MIVRLKNQKIVWIQSKYMTEGILLSEIVPNMNYKYCFKWEDVEEIYPVDKHGV